MLDEGAQELFGVLNPAAVLPRGACERREFAATDVGQRIHFQVGPEVLGGIELGRIGWKEHWMQPGRLGEIALGGQRPMR